MSAVHLRDVQRSFPQKKGLSKEFKWEQGVFWSTLWAGKGNGEIPLVQNTWFAADQAGTGGFWGCSLLEMGMQERAAVWVLGLSQLLKHFWKFGSSDSNLVQSHDIYDAFKNRVWIWYSPCPVFRCLWWPRPLGHFRKAKMRAVCSKSGILGLVTCSFLR